MFKLDLEKAEEPEIKLPTSVGLSKNQEFQKNNYFCFIDYAKVFDCMYHNKLWKILKEIGIPDHLTHLLRHLYVDQEATFRTRRGTTDWFQIGKGACQGCCLSPCLFNLYAEYIMRNAGLDEAQGEIKTARRNINNLRYADDTTLMEETEELKNLLMKVKEESGKVGLKLNIQKTKITASVPHPFMANRWGNNGNSETLFSWAPKALQMATAAMKLRCLLLGRKAIINLDSMLKSRHVTLPTKVHLVKAMVFPVVMYGCESWTIKEAEC